MAPAPASCSASSRPSSIHRFSIEYEGWWMSSGTPISRRIRAASSVRPGEYDEMPTYSALPCCTAVASAPMDSSSGVSGSGRWW